MTLYQQQLFAALVDNGLSENRAQEFVTSSPYTANLVLSAWDLNLITNNDKFNLLWKQYSY